MGILLVDKGNFRVELERKENYDLVVGEVVSYSKEPAREDTTIEFLLDFNVLLDFKVESPRNPPPREEIKPYIVHEMDKRMSEDLKRLFIEKLKETGIPFLKSFEVTHFEFKPRLEPCIAHCEVWFKVRSEVETTIPTKELYQIRPPSEISLRGKIEPLVEAVKEYIVQSLTDGDWFKELITKKFVLYEKETKITLKERSVRTSIVNIQMNFLSGSMPYSFSFVRFKIPVSKDIGDVLANFGSDGFEVLSLLIFYLSARREGPYKFGGEEVPLEIKIYYPFSNLVFEGKFDELFYSLSNYMNYGLKE